MNHELTALVVTAFSLGMIHTVLGPDHYIPFVAMAKARAWTTTRTLVLTILCGIGHVLSSVVLGFIGVALGVAVARLELIESVRGDIAAWVLTGFGLIYFIWGLRRAGRKHVHTHFTENENGQKANITPWILFTIFVLGPCEPLIPLIMYPAAKMSTGAVVLVALVFSVTTITTMTVMVAVLKRGIEFIPADRLHRYSHALAGFALLACGLAIQFGL
ncbi:MAG: hypothetical protein ACOYVF_06000 [Candidatus Zixiibacteriota bacterium]